MKNEEREVPANTSSEELAAQKNSSDKLDSLMNLSGELVITRARFTQLADALEAETALFREIKGKLDGLRTGVGKAGKGLKASDGKLDAVETSSARQHEDLDALLRLFGEVHEKLASSSIAKIANSLGETTLALGKISSDIQTGVMMARMVPAKAVFLSLEEEIKKAASAAGLKLSVSTEGYETEMDKKITGALLEALRHVALNSVRHAFSGTQAAPELRLRAQHHDNSVVIEISDNGKGLSTKEVVRRALEKKLLPASQAEALTEKEKFALAFLPGFSGTAEGGLAAAHKTMVALNGSLELSGREGEGTTVTLKIPLSLTIIKALLVVIGGETFALPLNSVTEIIKVPVNEIYSVDQDATIKLRGHALSLVDLHSVVHIGSPKNSADAAHKLIVIINNGEKKLGMEVDELIGEGEIVIKPLEDYLAGVKGIAGAAILGNGTIALILDCGSVINMAK